LSRPHSAKGLTSVPDAAWETARRRERIVRVLLQNPVAYGARSEAVAAAAAELDMTIQYLYRLIKVYEADPRTRSLLPRSPGGVADGSPCTEYQSVLSTRMYMDAGSGTGNRCPGGWAPGAMLGPGVPGHVWRRGQRPAGRRRNRDDPAESRGSAGFHAGRYADF
jgi:hypothetical protein